ncbi:6-phospho-beta-glucosidase [Streptomyces fuscichromogenes]|uniref:6-phospho-beta-glucosidase n=1 Tax=Streptomyces fuscichromogenes TaxID=1324013 RepID=A0A917XPX0_9ACTN|nr:6-phospho-beta-glucosidase [Streptomyces fuscichromogenes]GGN44480.1 6-phospho-beta-glucosidase [Streptomyces fuscichromogenes]
MKITVVGGGSTYTPELIEGFARRADLLPAGELVLHDIDAERLSVIGGLARRILSRHGFPGRLTVTTDLAQAVDGADAVLVQLRVGGQAARLVDETLPNRFGLLGQETTGPGGFAKALRTVPVVLGIAEEVRRRARPGAWIVDFTNPVGIVTRALLDAGHRAVGLCNVAIKFQRQLAARLGTDPGRVRLGHAGLNHLSWIRSVCVDGVDRLPELLTGDALDGLAAELRIPAGALRDLGAIPSYYLHYFYCTRQELRAQQEGPHRAEQVLAIERELLDLYADPALDRKPELLERRGGAYYSEAAAALVTSLLTGDGAHHYVNVRNDGVLAGLPDEAVVEVAADVDTGGPRPVPVPPLPPEMLGLVQAVTAYETLAVEAALTGDRTVARRALVANPLVREWETADALLDALLAANRRYLPRFFADEAVDA